MYCCFIVLIFYPTPAKQILAYTISADNIAYWFQHKITYKTVYRNLGT